MFQIFCRSPSNTISLTFFVEYILWNFHSLSKFDKYNEACRIYWDQHLKPSCEIWAHSERLKFFVKTCWQCLHFEILWNFHIFSKFTKFHQTCRIYWDQHLKPACESWAYSEKLKFCRKNADIAGNWKYYEISTASQNSSNIMKLAEYIGISIWNLHVKFEHIQRSYNISWKNADSVGTLKYNEIYTSSQSLPNLIKLAEYIGISIWNLHVKFEPIQRG